MHYTAIQSLLLILSRFIGLPRFHTYRFRKLNHLTCSKEIKMLPSINSLASSQNCITCQMLKWSNFYIYTYQNFAKFSGKSRHEWIIVCVKFHENWLGID